jgi:hypothetical protein
MSINAIIAQEKQKKAAREYLLDQDASAGIK